jgi:hypothetical protein
MIVRDFWLSFCPKKCAKRVQALSFVQVLAPMHEMHQNGAITDLIQIGAFLKNSKAYS